MDAFTAALAALHSDPNLSRSAIYRVGGTGDGVALRVIWSEPVKESEFGKTGAVAREIKADVRLADVADPATGDTIDVDGKSFIVCAPPLKDTEGLTATLTLKFKPAV